VDQGTVSNRDLQAFVETEQNPVPWDRRARLIVRQFGSVEQLAWRKAFRTDLDLYARTIKDILKLDQAPPGRPGPRPALDYDQGIARLSQYMGEDYSLEPFKYAFRSLAGQRSIRSLARKVDLSKTQVHRLLEGDLEPGSYEMSQIAKAFGKHPSFFVEWRAMWITNALVQRLIDNPEASIVLYGKLKG
jgi:DNA-binding phage protein